MVMVAMVVSRLGRRRGVTNHGFAAIALPTPRTSGLYVICYRGTAGHTALPFRLSSKASLTPMSPAPSRCLADKHRQIVLVNRGFVPTAMENPATRPEAPVEGDVRVSAVVRNGKQLATVVSIRA